MENHWIAGEEFLVWYWIQKDPIVNLDLGTAHGEKRDFLPQHTVSDYILYRWHHCGVLTPRMVYFKKERQLKQVLKIQKVPYHEWFYSKTRFSVHAILHDTRATIPDVVTYLKITKQAVAVFEVSVLTLF